MQERVVGSEVTVGGRKFKPLHIGLGGPIIGYIDVTHALCKETEREKDDLRKQIDKLEAKVQQLEMQAAREDSWHHQRFKTIEESLHELRRVRRRAKNKRR